MAIHNSAIQEVPTNPKVKGDNEKAAGASSTFYDRAKEHLGPWWYSSAKTTSDSPPSTSGKPASDSPLSTSGKPASDSSLSTSNRHYTGERFRAFTDAMKAFKSGNYRLIDINTYIQAKDALHSIRDPEEIDHWDPEEHKSPVTNEDIMQAYKELLKAHRTIQDIRTKHPTASPKYIMELYIQKANDEYKERLGAIEAKKMRGILGTRRESTHS